MSRIINPSSITAEKGVTVCDDWRDHFRYFLEDVGMDWRVGTNIIRINTDGNYEPENCRWSIYAEQIITWDEPRKYRKRSSVPVQPRVNQMMSSSGKTGVTGDASNSKQIIC